MHDRETPQILARKYGAEKKRRKNLATDIVKGVKFLQNLVSVEWGGSLGGDDFSDVFSTPYLLYVRVFYTGGGVGG